MDPRSTSGLWGSWPLKWWRENPHTSTKTLSEYVPLHVHVSNTVEPPNNGHLGDECFVHCSEVVPSSEVEMYGQYMYIVGRGRTVCP